MKKTIHQEYILTKFTSIKCSNIKSGKNRIINRIKEQGSLKDNYPELLKEWDYEKNEFGPENYTCGSHYKPWWKCNICGNEWQTEIKVRTAQKSKCPKCHGLYK